MRKRIGSLLLSLALCLTLLPTAAFAEKAQPEEPLPGEQLEQVQPVQEEPEENEEPSRQDGDVIAVQEMINALPDASELDEMDAEAQESACLAASEAYDAYDALPEEQQSALTGADNMLAILEWATRQIELLANEDLSDHTTHGEGWTAINSEEGLKNLTGKGYLTDNVTLSDTWKPDNGVVLCLNGKTITGATGKEAIRVNGGVTFTLTDCSTSTPGKITHATDKTGRGVTVDTDGIFYMYGGSISHNEVTSGSVRQGSGVTVNAGGAFHMYGGSISDNKVSGSNSVGGGVYVGSGTFHMYGGSIADNTAQSGGGVYVGTSTFHMYGGSISGNTAESGNGGGVYMAGGEFTMSGGTIENNTATDPSTNYGKGGGVYINRGTFTMTGGSITNNTALNFGGGVCVGGNATAFTVSGNVAVTENLSSGTANDVYLYSGKYITVDGKLDSTAKIGVTCAAIDSGAFVTVETGAKGSCTEGNFTANKDEPYCIKVEQGADANRVNVNLYNGQPHTHCVCGKTDCTGAGHNNSTVWKGVSSLTDITEEGNYYLTKDVTLTSTWTPADGVKLCLNGHTITTTANVDAIEVDQNVTFTLTNCKGTGKITHQYTGQDNRVYTAKGCGAYVNGGTFHLYGGTFSKNIGHNIGQNTNGGGVYLNGGTFYMYGGSITDNSAGNTNDYTDGGGVYLNGSTFHMSGGSIIGNGSGSCGGGVYVDANSTFTLSGSASITGNRTNGSGGGVYVCSYSKFEMHDNASITGNSAKSQGGGVHVGWIGQFSMYGGSITGNNVEKNNGGGVNLASGTVTVSGSAKITGNVKGGKNSNGIYTGGTANNVGLNVSSSITIGDGLTDTARIGVANEPTESNPVKIATGATGDLSVYKDIFTPDVTGKGYVITKDGTDLYLSAHQHRWTYAQGSTTDTITAKCNATGCPASDGGSVTISAPTDLIYDGTAKEAMLDTTSGSWQGGDVSIVYKKGEETFSTAPTDAGTYTASITLGDATASVEYTIAKATPTINWQSYPYNKNFTGSEIANPQKTDIKIHDGKNNDLDLFTEIAFKWYEATKNGGNYTKANETPLTANPIDAGDYIIEATIAATNNTESATITKGLTVNKATDLGGYDKTVPVAVDMYPSSAEKVYTVDLDKILAEKEIRSGGSLALYATVGIQTQSNWVNSADLEGTTVKITMKALPSTNTGLTATVNVNLTSRNYEVIPVVITLTLQKKPTVNDITVSMDGWTYGGTANTPEYTVPEGVTATVTYAAQGSSDFSTTVPTNAGKYTVKVTYETDSKIHIDTAEFTIAPKTLTQDDLDGIPNKLTKVYDGTDQHTESIRLADNDTRLNITVDKSKITYNNANAGKATSATLSLEGIALGPNYKFADSFTSITVPAEITQRAITVQKVTAADRTYKKDNKDVDVSVIFKDSNDSEITLVKGTDYTATGTMDTDTATGDAGEKDVAVTVKLKNGNYSMTDYTGTAKVKIWKLPAPTVTAPQLPQRWNDTTEKTVTPEWTGIPEDAGTTTFSTTGTIFPENYITFGRDYSVAVATGALTYAFTGVTAADVNKVITVKYNISMENYMETPVEVKILITDRMVQEEFKFTEGTKTVTYGDPNFTVTADGAVTGSSVTYSSSDESVATVDSATGKVHIVGAGTAVITAKASETAEYNEKTVSYTLTVGKKQIAIPAADATVFTYNGKPQTYALAENEAYTVSGNVQTDANETGYSVKAVLKDTANTQWADGMTADKIYTFVIGKVVITVTAKDQTAYVGDKAPALGADSCIVSGLVGEEKLTTQPTVKYVDADGKESAPDMTKTGETIIRASDADAGSNYTIRYEDGKLTVSTRPSGGSSSNNSSYTVSVDKTENGAITVSPKSASKGDTVTVTVKPDKGYKLDTLKVLDKNGDTVKLTEKNGKYTFTMPAGKVTVKGSFVEEDPEQIFADVPVDAYYYEAVKWAAEKDITGGIGNGLFAPKLNCTRAQIVTFLWRAAGSPEPKSANSFADVSADSYYAKAVAWAVENGITGGTGNGKFSPNATCTREQAVAFLYRASSSPAVSGGSAFSDVAASAYYADAVAWAEQNGVTGGIGNGKFGTGSACTRAQIVTFLYRAYQGK